MEQLTKLEVMACDDQGLPIMEESRSWDNLEAEWFQNLSNEDKEKVNQIINNKTNN
jgi:hypothetical protein